MKRYLHIVKMDKIKTLLEEENFEEAQLLAEEIEKENIKEVSDIYLLAEVYRKNGNYNKAKELLIPIYEKRESHRVVKELLELCLLQNNIEEAETYFKKHQFLCKGDPINYVYEYQIGRLKGKSDKQLLPVLQTLREELYIEKYAYELAKTYHKLGLEEECLTECSELILFFNEGTYVERAKALQSYYYGEFDLEELQEKDAELGELAISIKEKPKEVVQPKVNISFKEPSQPKKIVPLEEPIQKEMVSSEEVKEEKSLDVDEEYKENIYQQLENFMNYTKENVEVDEETLQETNAVSLEKVEKEPVLQFSGEMSFVPPEVELVQEYLDEEENFDEFVQDLEESNISLEKILHHYASIPSVRTQVLRGLKRVVTENRACHSMIITGDKKNGKTTLAQNMIRLIAQVYGLGKPKFAVISGTKMNTLSLELKRGQLQNCYLIVEEASKLTPIVYQNLIQFAMYENVISMLILEDTTENMNALQQKFPQWTDWFQVQINLPKYTEEDLLGFVVECIQEQGYIVEDDTKAAFLKKITAAVKNDQGEGRLVKTFQITKDALEKANACNRANVYKTSENGNPNV